MVEKNNISFQYLHRDEGNYKIFGEVVFSNKKVITPEKAEKILRKKFIDSEFFYPLKNGIDLFPEHRSIFHFSDWYEFEKFSQTMDEPTDTRDISIFLSQFQE